MQEIPAKSDSTAGANGQLPAAEWNDRNVEFEKVVSRSGQTLSAGITDQFSKALFINAIGAATVVDSGSGNSITLQPLTGGSGLVPPGDYAHFDGGRVLFDKVTPNTGTAVTIAAWGLTAKPLVRKDLSLPLAGDVIGLCVARWDNAGDRWILESNETDTYGYAVNASGAIAPAFANNTYNVDLSGGNISISVLPVPGFLGQRIDFVGEGSGLCDIAAGTGLLAVSFNETEGISIIAVEKSGALQWEIVIDRKRICKAWVNFDGTGTPTIRDSFNVSSIIDNGPGDYTINFTNALSDANYSAVVSASAQHGTRAITGVNLFTSPPQTAQAPTINGFRFYINALSVDDVPYVTAIVFGS